MSRQFSQQAPAQPRRLNSNGAPPLSANGSVMNHNGASHSNNGSASPGASSNNLYQQLIDSSDLVKELDDIEAISQQISQHAEVLYQNWKSNSQPRQSTVSIKATFNHRMQSQSQTLNLRIFAFFSQPKCLQHQLRMELV